MNNKKKGFTLIEVIVSIAIASLAMAAIGSMIINSFAGFASATNTKLKKDSLDSVVEYINEQVKYSTEVWKWSPSVDGKETPDITKTGWHYLNVVDGRLQRDGKEVFDSSFYNGKSNKLSIHLSNIKDTKIKINLDYSLKNDDEVYTKKDAIELVNIKKDDSKNNSKNAKESETSKMNFDLENSEGYCLYYRKDLTSVVESNSSEEIKPVETNYSYTVFDKLSLMTGHLNRGYYTSSACSTNNYMKLVWNNDQYHLGDFVYYKSNWYLKVLDNNNNNGPDNRDNGWQKMSEEYDSNSMYRNGDIIKYKGNLYRVRGDYSGGIDSNPNLLINIYGNWVRALKQSELSNVKNYSSETTYHAGDIAYFNGKYQMYNLMTPGKGIDGSYAWADVDVITETTDNIYSLKLYPGYKATQRDIQVPNSSPLLDSTRKNFDIDEVTFDSIKEWVYKRPWWDIINLFGNNYDVNEVVKLKYKDSTNTGNKPYYQLYKKVFKTDDNLEPGTLNSGWELLENDYQPYSSYKKGASVRIGKNIGTVNNLNFDGSVNDYIQCLSNSYFMNSDALLSNSTIDNLYIYFNKQNDKSYLRNPNLYNFTGDKYNNGGTEMSLVWTLRNANQYNVNGGNIN